MDRGEPVQVAVRLPVPAGGGDGDLDGGGLGGVRSRPPRSTVSINATISSSQWVRTVSHHCRSSMPSGLPGMARALSRSGMPGPSRSTVPSTARTTGTHSPRMSQGTTNGRPKSVCRVTMVLASDDLPEPMTPEMNSPVSPTRPSRRSCHGSGQKCPPENRSRPISGPAMGSGRPVTQEYRPRRVRVDSVCGGTRASAAIRPGTCRGAGADPADQRRQQRRRPASRRRRRRPASAPSAPRRWRRPATGSAARWRSRGPAGRGVMPVPGPGAARPSRRPGRFPGSSVALPGCIR